MRCTIITAAYYNFALLLGKSGVNRWAMRPLWKLTLAIFFDPLMTEETAHYALNLHYQHVGKRLIVGMVYFYTHSDNFGGVKSMIADAKVAASRFRVLALKGFS